MKLTSAQVERTLGQFEARAIPDDHPVIPQLNDLFGEHTFFLDRNGLNIVEPAEAAAGAASQSAKVNGSRHGMEGALLRSTSGAGWHIAKPFNVRGRTAKRLRLDAPD
jgi:hypothetical protein